MMNYFRLGALAFLLSIMGIVDAAAQTASGSGNGRFSVERSVTVSAATICNGSPTGRWRVWVDNIVVMMTLEVVKQDGEFKVRTQRNPKTQARGLGIDGFADVAGGTLFKNDPLVNKHTNSNQCFLTGTIRIAGNPNVSLSEVWIERGSSTMKGWCVFNGGTCMFEAQKY